MSTEQIGVDDSSSNVAAEGHGGVHFHAIDRLFMHRLGLWLFILSETFLFAAIISSRYFLQGLDRPEELDQNLGLAITLILIGSSWTAYRAEMFAAHGEHRKFQLHLLATIGLGILFIVGVGIEWNDAFEHFPPGGGPEENFGFGTIFFTTTGIHAFHVLTGLIALSVAYFLGRDGRFSSGKGHWGVEGTVKYWHFVDVAWVFIYPSLYLIN